MSVFDKLLDSIKLNDDDYDEDNYLDEDLMDDDEGAPVFLILAISLLIMGVSSLICFPGNFIFYLI